jgi:hypothetical protein
MMRFEQIGTKLILDFNRKERATRGASACAARAIPQIVNIQSSIFNFYSLSGLGG